MKEFLIFVGIFATYIILQKWILPKLGIQT
jgi:hypothetical protein